MPNRGSFGCNLLMDKDLFEDGKATIAGCSGVPLIIQQNLVLGETRYFAESEIAAFCNLIQNMLEHDLNDKVRCAFMNQMSYENVSTTMQVFGIFIMIQLFSDADNFSNEAIMFLNDNREQELINIQSSANILLNVTEVGEIVDVESTRHPSTEPSSYPSKEPSSYPTVPTTLKPTLTPTDSPSLVFSNAPTMFHTSSPSNSPSISPTIATTFQPSFDPTGHPSVQPTKSSASPSYMPSDGQPSFPPSKLPTTPSPTISSTVCGHLKGRRCKKSEVCRWEKFTKTCYGPDDLPSCSSATSVWICNKLNKINTDCEWSYTTKMCVHELNEKCIDHDRSRRCSIDPKCKWEKITKTCHGLNELPSCSSATSFWKCNKFSKINTECKWSSTTKTCVHMR